MIGPSPFGCLIAELGVNVSRVFQHPSKRPILIEAARPQPHSSVPKRRLRTGDDDGSEPSSRSLSQSCALPGFVQHDDVTRMNEIESSVAALDLLGPLAGSRSVCGYRQTSSRPKLRSALPLKADVAVN